MHKFKTERRKSPESILYQLELEDHYKMIARGLGSKNREVLMVVNQLLSQIGDFKAKSRIVSQENGFGCAAKHL